MNQHNVSAEDKLLKLIKDKKTNIQIPVFNSPVYKNKLHKSNIFFNLTTINKFLTYALLLCIISFFISLIFSTTKNTNSLKADLKKEELSLDRKETSDFSNYISNFDRKNLFLSSTNAREAYFSNSNELMDNIDTQNLLKDINLLGIISGEVPQAIIEDKKTQKTYFLSKGSSFNQVKVLEIKEGKVLLDYKGKNFELFL